jgi:hypothetical protein
MADGVRWEIDIEAKADSAKAASAALERMEKNLQRVDGSTASLAASFSKAHKQGEAGFKGIGHAVDEMNSKIKHAFEFAGVALAFEAIKGIAEKMAEIGSEAVKSAASEQRMMRVFEAAAGSKELGRQNEEWADILSKQTEFNEAQTEGAFIDLKRVGATDQEAKLALKAAADIAAVSKNKDEAFGSTVEAFARLQRTGVISNRTLAPLGLGVKDFKQLDSMKGLSDKEIAKRMEAGQVDRGDLFHLIMSRTGEKAIGERAANNADLLGTKLSKLTELPDKFFKKLADTKAIGTLTTAIDGILTKLDPDSPTGRKISGFLEGAFTNVADGIASIDFGGIADTLTNDVGPALKALTGTIKPTVEAVERIVRGFHEMHDIAFGPAAKNAALDDFDRRQKAGAEHAAAEDEPGFLSKGNDVGGGAKAWHGKFHTVGEAAGEGLAAGMTDSAAKAEDAAANMADRATDATRRKLKVHSPSVVFEDIGAMTAAGFIQGVEGAGAEVDRSVDHTFDFAAGGRGTGGGSSSITFAPGSIQINVTGGGDGAEQGKAAADAFSARVRSEFLSIVDQANVEGGNG